jgi:pyrroline-5-carboxylate reductase
MFKVGIIGIGNMGEAILNGLIKNSGLKSDEIIVSDINQERINYIVNKYSVAGTDNNQRVVNLSQIIFLVVKPKDFEKTVKPLKEKFKGKTVISVIAGLKIEKIKSFIQEADIVRIMPNTGAFVGESATGITFDEGFPENKKEEILNLINSFGKSFVIDENLMDAFTGLAGSGPAYIFTIIDAFAQAGVKQGFSYNQALEIITQTIKGSIELLKEFSEHPCILRDKVTSPAGTTIYGLHELEKGGIRNIIINTIEKSTQRSVQLSH